MNESGIMSATSGTVNTVAMANELSRMKARKHTFSYYDVDDISQEIWLSVQKAAPKFDPERADNPKSFFNVATENALKNLKRDNRIIDNVNISDGPIHKEDSSFEEEQGVRDLYAFIIDGLPARLKSPFEIMVKYGGEGVSQYIKTKVRAAVTRLLRRYKDE